MYTLKTYLKPRIQIEINSIICFYNGKKYILLGDTPHHRVNPQNLSEITN